MQERSYRFPVLQRDLALIVGGVVCVSALFGAAVGAAVDALLRHRAA